jgi:myo-inositol-1(or 4)-monophosphatase
LPIILDYYYRILAEESVTGHKQTEMVLTDAPTWVIDPIDGTNNFIHGISFICISIALVIEKDVKIAIIYNPCRDEMFSAQKGKGAFLNGERIYTSNVENVTLKQIIHL